MNLEFFLLEGYGYFVWPSFLFTFIICFVFYLKTKKELIKQEKLFLKEFKVLQTKKIKIIKTHKEKRRALSISSI
tara:strand:+ start:323 stop:547 length:225 start_codon:yes stop_codon:yes gene_type:complete